MSDDGEILHIRPLGKYHHGHHETERRWNGTNEDFIDEEATPHYPSMKHRTFRKRYEDFPRRTIPNHRYDTSNKSLDSTEKDYAINRQDSMHDDDEILDGVIVCCFYCSPCVARVNVMIGMLLLIFAAGFGFGISTSSSLTPTAATNGMEAPIMPTLAPTIQDETNQLPTLEPTESSYPDSEATIVPDESIEDDDFIFDAVPPGSSYLVGVYYYPWHGENFHNGDGYIRNQLTPPQAPALGEYDDSKASTIAQHLKWSRQANIGLWVTSWWGPNLMEDSNTRDVIMEHEDLGDMKIALHYETMGRIEHNETSKVTDLSRVPDDINYICQRFFSHPNYYRIDGRPVLVVYLTRLLEEWQVLEETLLLIRNAANQCGQNVFIIGDHVYGDAPNTSETIDAFSQLDAVTNYDVFGGMGRPMKYAGIDSVDDYYNEQQKWRHHAIMSGCRYIPATSPGYNDRGVRLLENHPPLSRRLSLISEEGSLFRYQLQKALPLVDKRVDNLILVNSFNEWHEDTQIEPAVGDTASFPVQLTAGLQYEGYGELYLNILRESTFIEDDNIFNN
jgi:glycoprotein endo-alpha-1,2-mannosidase